MLPNFLIVGAPKSGTTSLHVDLMEHPEIILSSKKESHFFRVGFEGLPWNGPGIMPDLSTDTIEKYKKLFISKPGAKAIGEVCPSYFYPPETPLNIKKTLGCIRIIILLRDPSDRAFSQYVYSRMLGCEPEEDFLTAISSEKLRKENNWGEFWYYIHQSFYADIIKRYFNLFGESNVLVLFSDDYLNKRENTLIKLYKFLDVEPNFAKSQSVIKRNENFSGLPKNRFFIFFHKNIRPSLGNKYFKKLMPEKCKYLYRKFIRHSLKKTKMTCKERKQLTMILKDDIVQLEKILGVDLKHWLS
jgi:hypothetical protein